MMKLILAALLLGVSLCASAQTNYVPLQPGHAALPWYDVTRSGEGLMLSLIPASGDHTVFATIYLADPDVTWYTAQGSRNDSFTVDCPRGWTYCYELDLYRTTGIGVPADWHGVLWLRPGFSAIDWLLVLDDGDTPVEARDARLTTFAPVSVGECNRLGGFGPHRPSAGEWCHGK